MTVREHLDFALRLRRWPKQEASARVSELAAWLGLDALLDRRPRGLSGGEAQRVALGRALSFRPAILCLDEPLSALDDETKEEMYTLLHSVQQHEQVTVLHVTHSHADVERLADVLLRLTSTPSADGKTGQRVVSIVPEP
jgi:ABC-type sugar transport system ATPase subunit